MKQKHVLKIHTKDIALLGVLIAVEVIITRFFAIENSFIRISFSFLPLMLMGHLFGPWLAGLGGVAGDLIGMMIFPKAMFFPGFTLNAFLIPFIYGCFFYKKDITLKRNITAQLLIALSISLFLTPIWLNMLFKIPIIELLPVRLLKESVLLPLNILLSHYLFNKTSLVSVMEMSK
ncbi:folate family ECF transporter S component [Enterococcus rivorum]|uniref:Folate family ECF transporter S component n=1 Tax=Enterococcus rivorum TaxID=762845 RepID=A0A1E5KXV0_9ENTE|nr:folate family ECF transporter S component [Enterococcus rivorum]MBP2099752.1 ECF transporter S component (folate family) [Enterococcus rivorum]OEH82663.1 hypothetical protein BCR26_12600 [Enterococcus rivorum]